MKSFILMLTFLTRIPVPMNFEFNDEDFSKGLLFLPVIGLVIGLPMYLFVKLAAVTNGRLMAFILILIYLAVTGGLHLDGLADYFDGMFSGRTRERILAIMKDSSIGTFGVIGLCLYFIGLHTGLMYAEPLALLLMPFVARTVGLGMCAFGTYPREAGMGQALVDYGRWYHGILAMGIMLTVCGLTGSVYLIGAAVVIGVMAVFYLRTVQVIGGITGDVIGASVEISQVLWLLVLAAVKGVG